MDIILRVVVESRLREVGRVVHFYPKVSVAIVKLSDTLNAGDKVLIKGLTTNVEQTVDSMEIEHKPVSKAVLGESVGLKVTDRVRENDVVYVVA